MRKYFVILTGLVLALMFFASVPTRSKAQKGKLLHKPDKIKNNYIVVLDDSVVGEKGAYSIAPYLAQDMSSAYKGKLKHIYQHALNGFSVEMSEADAEALSQDYRVK